MSDEDLKFNVEESRALLLHIWPEWPGARGMRPTPDLREFLEALRVDRKNITRETAEAIPRE